MYKEIRNVEICKSNNKCLNWTIYSDIFGEEDKVEHFKKFLFKEFKLTEENLLSELKLKSIK